MIKRIINILKGIFTGDFFYKLNRYSYSKYYKKLPIIDKTILLESSHGVNIDGNIFYILKELMENEAYSDYKIYLVVEKDTKSKIEKMLEFHKFSGIECAVIRTKKYYKLMSSCKYLFNDTSFLPFFTKKEGQIYLNTWHGTPLKTLGKKVKNDILNIGNIQKNFVSSDYLLYPNEYTMDHMVEDYMLENISESKILLTGYPRNTIFFDKKARNNVKKELNLSGKQVIAYMPTWRGTVRTQETDKLSNIIKKHLDMFEEKLSDNQIMFVNLHPLDSASVDLNVYKKIKPFDKRYETYEFLNACDVLVTDYSSVFYDYALTKNKIILFTYDKEEYLRDRGMYISMDELPFPQANSVDELFKKIDENISYNIDEFLKKYCKYDNLNATKDLLKKVILNKKTNVKEIKMKNNGKKNILLYPGPFKMNGITTSLSNLLNNIDLDKYNIYLTFQPSAVANNPGMVDSILKKVNYFPIMGGVNCTLFERILIFFNSRFNLGKKVLNKIEKIFDTEVVRTYGPAKFDNVIQFYGYNVKFIMLFSKFKCKKSIFCHADINEEIVVKKNQKKHIIEYAYNAYDKVAIVNETLLEPTQKYVDKSNWKKIVIVDNCIDVDGIIEKSKKKVSFDKDTISNVSLKDLNKILDSNAKKYINVGRFSYEKGHFRLIDAFDKLWKENKDIYLIIIGGYGNLYEDTLKYAKSKESSSNIVIIFSMSNPFPVIKKCSCFVLSSEYEGFGLALIEADILGLQTFSTDVVGPRTFIENNHGNLVDNSEDGIYTGMKNYLDNSLKTMKVDYKKYNSDAINKFYNLLK